LKKVINRIYPNEFISDNMQFDLMALKPTISSPKNYSLRFQIDQELLTSYEQPGFI